MGVAVAENIPGVESSHTDLLMLNSRSQCSIRIFSK